LKPVLEVIQLAEPVPIALEILVLIPQLLGLPDHVAQLVTALLQVPPQGAVLVPHTVLVHPLIGLADLEPELFRVLLHVLQLSLLLGCRHGWGLGALLRLARGSLGLLSRTLLSRSVDDEHQGGDETESQHAHVNLPWVKPAEMIAAFADIHGGKLQRAP
jgi:hypothetical protein